jgi:hypothetical protein
MAKISAYGDSKAAEWKDRHGCRLVLTEKGRVLRNYLKGDGLSTVVTFQMRGNKHKPTLEEVEQYATLGGFSRVYTVRF